jgi:hypothetical protein
MVEVRYVDTNMGAIINRCDISLILGGSAPAWTRGEAFSPKELRNKGRVGFETKTGNVVSGTKRWRVGCVSG